MGRPVWPQVWLNLEESQTMSIQVQIGKEMPWICLWLESENLNSPHLVVLLFGLVTKSVQSTCMPFLSLIITASFAESSYYVLKEQAQQICLGTQAKRWEAPSDGEQWAVTGRNWEKKEAGQRDNSASDFTSSNRGNDRFHLIAYVCL